MFIDRVHIKKCMKSLLMDDLYIIFSIKVREEEKERTHCSVTIVRSKGVILGDQDFSYYNSEQNTSRGMDLVQMGAVTCVAILYGHKEKVENSKLKKKGLRS